VSRKAYYSIRTGKNPNSAQMDLKMLRRFFKNLYSYFEDEGYFQKYLGKDCVDAGFIAGELGQDLEGAFLVALRKDHLTPIWQKVDEYSEDDVFDVIEFLFDHCAKPTKRTYHSWNECGWHCEEYDEPAGKMEFRERINEVLAYYGDGFELSNSGEVLSLAEIGLEGLFEAPIPTPDPENVERRIEAARLKWRRHRATWDDRREAIRELADVLEFLRPKLKEVLKTEDEKDLFNIANNFGIRHHNQKQKINYDKPIWFSWMFYYYLTTLHAALRLIEKAKAK